MDIIEALAACLPPVSYDTQAPEVTRELRAVADVLEDAIASAGVVVTEHQPDLVDLALPDWERNYSLPDDPVAAATETAAERRADLIARIRARGNLSRQHMIDLAALVGFPEATITEPSLMTCEDPCDGAVNDDSWIGAWQLNAPAGPGSQQLLQRLMQRRKPAHTVVFINFES